MSLCTRPWSVWRHPPILLSDKRNHRDPHLQAPSRRRRLRGRSHDAVRPRTRYRGRGTSDKGRILSRAFYLPRRRAPGDVFAPAFREPRALVDFIRAVLAFGGAFFAGACLVFAGALLVFAGTFLAGAHLDFAGIRFAVLAFRFDAVGLAERRAALGFPFVAGAFFAVGPDREGVFACGDGPLAVSART
jgi:hypothetical protein